MVKIKSNDDNLDGEGEVGFVDVAPALEFMCWVVVLLAPFLRWVNGAAVTTDQFVVQCTLVSLALTGALSLRIYAIVRRKSNQNSAMEGQNLPQEKED